METITTSDGHQMIKYDFSEKFFQIEPEWRIRRYQYIARMLGGGVWLSIIFVFASQLIWSNAIVGIGINILFVLWVSLIWLVLNIKRIRDIGKDPKNIRNITLGLISWRLIAIIYSTIWEAWWLPWYVWYFQVSLHEMARKLSPETSTPLMLPWHQTAMEYIGYWFGLIAFILFLYLLFIPGNKWDNQNGKDPMNTKVSFLG